MAAWRALAAGSTRAAKSTLGSGGSHDPATAFEMGAVWRDLSGRPRAAKRQSAGVVAVADGPHGTGIFGLSQFRRLYRVEQLADLFHHRRLAPPPRRRRAAEAPTGGADRATAVQRTPRVAATISACRLQCRQGRRRHGPAKPQRGQGDADQIRPARGLLAHRRIAGADARRAARTIPSSRIFGCPLESDDIGPSGTVKAPPSSPTTERASHVLLRRFRSGVPANSQ